MEKKDVMMVVCISAVLMIMVSVGSASIYGDCADITHQKKPKSSDPVCINGNSNFTEENSVTGGNGTDSNPFIIENLEIDASSANGIGIRNTDKHFIIRNCIIQNGTANDKHGVHFSNVTNGIIDNVTVYNNSCGIYLDSYSNNNCITECKGYDCEIAVCFENAFNNIIANCTLHNNTDDNIAIYLYDSDNNQIIDCDVYGNAYGIFFDGGLNNSVTNCDIYNNIIDDGMGLCFDSAGFNQIINCTIYNNHESVYLYDSSNNTILNCDVYNNSDVGIYLYYSSNNQITNCTAYNNNECGIYLGSSSYNNITHCDCYNNNYGIYLYDSQKGNQITDSTLHNNSNYAIYITESVHVSTKVKSYVYHNNFINNSAYDDSVNTIWDKGYLFGGNYWGNYTGIDADGDGIGDTPYNISGGDNKDNYPLIHEFTWWDTEKPVISLILPENNSIIKHGTSLDFNIADDNLWNVSYWMDNGVIQYFSSQYNISVDWSDGTHNITVYAKDWGMNKISKTFRFTVDSILPDISLISPENNSVIKTGEFINFEIEDVHLNLTTYTLDDSLPETLSPPYNISTVGWEDGVYNITIWADDLAGNKITGTFTFTLDGTPPDISITNVTNGSYYNTNVTISIIISDAHLDEDKNIITLDNVNVSSESGVTVSSVGTYVLYVYATDTAGNNASETIIFTIDKTAPIITIVGSSHTTNKKTFTMSWSSSENVQYYEISTDGVNWENVSTSTQYTFTLSKGDNTLYVRGTDLAGNINTASITIEKVEEKEEGMPDYLIYLIAISVVFVVALIAGIAFLKRKIRIRCPACGTVFDVKPGKKPLKIKCPKCGKEGVLT